MPIVAGSEGETLSLLTNWNSFIDIKESFQICFYDLGIKRRKNVQIIASDLVTLITQAGDSDSKARVNKMAQMK